MPEPSALGLHSRRRPFESEFGETRFERRRLQAELFGRAADAANSPSRAFENAAYVGALDVDQSDAAPSRG